MKRKLNKKIKVGLLLNGYNVPLWAYYMIELVQNSFYAEITCIILNGTKGDKACKTNTTWNRRIGYQLLQLISNLDKYLYKKRKNPFELRDVRGLLNVNEISVEPRRTKFSDFILKEDLKQIEKEKCDLLIRLGFRILRGDILSLPKYGIWSFHHGDYKTNKGGPAGLWELIENRSVTGVTLQVLNEELDAGLILQRGVYATDKSSLINNKSALYLKAYRILPLELEKLYKLGDKQYFLSKRKNNDYPQFYCNPLYKFPKLNQLIILGINKYFCFFKAKIINKFYFDQWCIGYNFNENLGFKPLYNYQKIVPPKDRFWADPFPISYKNEQYVFFEELIYSENKGRICYIKLDKTNGIIRKGIALEKEFHLSYPNVFEYKESIYMIPESAANNKVQLYKCIRFPDKWEMVETLIDDIYAVDSTITFENNMFWLFCNVKINEHSCSHDELHIYFSENLEHGNWSPHINNPIKIDVRSSRPAGNFLTFNESKYRVSQNSALRYGYQINIFKLKEINMNEYSEKLVQEILPNWDNDIKGIHTYNRNSHLEVVDFLIRTPRFWNN